ncbi:MAG: hypothetical protein JWR21_935 [Herminiimonas sp.]|nr:hypothetical protein [Herminiimonas sp.]
MINQQFLRTKANLAIVEGLTVRLDGPELLELCDALDAAKAEIERLREKGTVAFNLADNRDADLERAQSEMAALKQDAARMLALLTESQSIFGTDWRNRRDEVVASLSTKGAEG